MGTGIKRVPMVAVQPQTGTLKVAPRDVMRPLSSTTTVVVEATVEVMAEVMVEVHLVDTRQRSHRPST